MDFSNVDVLYKVTTAKWESSQPTNAAVENVERVSEDVDNWNGIESDNVKVVEDEVEFFNRQPLLKRVSSEVV